MKQGLVSRISERSYTTLPAAKKNPAEMIGFMESKY